MHILFCLFSFAGEDYDASTIPTSIVVIAGEKESCFVVDIVNDNIHEPVQESFDISAQISGSVASVSVIIVDNDGKVAF